MSDVDSSSSKLSLKFPEAMKKKKARTSSFFASSYGTGEREFQLDQFKNLFRH